MLAVLLGNSAAVWSYRFHSSCSPPNPNVLTLQSPAFDLRLGAAVARSSKTSTCPVHSVTGGDILSLVLVGHCPKRNADPLPFLSWQEEKVPPLTDGENPRSSLYKVAEFSHTRTACARKRGSLELCGQSRGVPTES